MFKQSLEQNCLRRASETIACAVPGRSAPLA